MSNFCGLSVKTSRFKGHDFVAISFHFLTDIIKLSKCLLSSFSKLGRSYAFFLIVFFASSNFINLNSNHKNISFSLKRLITEILDVNKLRCRKFQVEIVENIQILTRKLDTSFIVI